jgi:hypothetical protein
MVAMSKQHKTATQIAMGVFNEFLGSALTVLSIYGVRKLVEYLLGGELLWDILPIKYCADTVDAAVFLRFIWQILRTFND